MERPLPIFIRFLRFGFLAFGGPVAQIAMIRRELVEEERWISGERFNRLLAVYQALPGPEARELCVHLGRMRGGALGGLLAGLGFMLPGFLIVLGLAALYSRMDLTYPAIIAAMLGMQVAVAATAIELAIRLQWRLPDLSAGLAIFGAAAAILWFVRSRWTALWLVPAAGLVGWALLR